MTPVSNNSENLLVSLNNNSENISQKNSNKNNLNLQNNENNHNSKKNVYFKNNVLQLWHERLMHQNFASVKKFLNKNNIKFKNDTPFCDACALGKIHRKPFYKSDSFSKRVIELVHADLCGPMEINSIGNSRYFVLLKDDFSKYNKIYFLKNKSETCKFLKNYILRLEIETGQKFNTLRTDNGLEFINREVSELTNKFAIKHERSVAYTPEQNGSAERENRSVIELARTILIRNKLNKNLWAEACNSVVYVVNRTKNVDRHGKTPYELWHNKKCSFAHLKIFGTEVYGHIPKQKRLKWDAKGKLGIFVGYDENVKAYKVLTANNKIELYRDVLFKNELYCCNINIGENIGKLGVFVGYDEDEKAYKVLTANNKIELYKNVLFKNEVYCYDNNIGENIDSDSYLKIIFDNNDNNHKKVIENNIPVANINLDGDLLNLDENFENLNQNNELINNENFLEQQDNDNNLDENLNDDNDSFYEVLDNVNPNIINLQQDIEEENKEKEPNRYNLRNRNELKPPEKSKDYYCFYSNDINNLFLSESFEPITLKDALEGKDSRHWEKAINDELDSLIGNKTWRLVEKTKNMIILKSRWVFKIKIGPNGQKIYKARLVVKGYLQRPGIDYGETFSPVARYESIRAFLSIAACYKMHLKQFDVKTAFLNGDLNETVYMYPPEGFSVDKNKVCKLEKSLYGLKQSAKCFNDKFIKCLKEFNLHATTADPCVFVSRDNKEKIILILYVDDGAIACKNEKRIDDLINHLKRKLKITVKELNMFLGIEIKKMPNGLLFANQKKFAEKIINKFKQVDAHPVALPIDPYERFDNFEKDSRFNNRYYKEAIGSLIFLSMVTRPDISYSVGVLSRYAENPTKAHCNGVKRIIKYIKGTLNHGLIFGRCRKENSINILAFSDADFAGDSKTRRSTSGCLIKLGSDLITWSSRKQPTVALSTTESEFIAACNATQEIIWLKRLIKDLIGKDFCNSTLMTTIITLT